MKLRENNKVGAWIIFAFSILILGGWIFDITLLKSGLPEWPTSKFNTGLCFLFLSGALLLIDRPGRVWNWSGSVLLFINLAITSLTLIEYGTGIDYGIDQIFVRDTVRETTGNYYPGRMAGGTALCFLLLSQGLLMYRTLSRSIQQTGQYLVIIALNLSMISVFSYIFNVPILDRIPFYQTMSIYTSSGFLVLSMIILYTRPRLGIMRIVTEKELGGLMIRNLLPTFLIGLLCLGIVLITLQRAHLLEGEFGIALFSVTNWVFFGAVIFMLSRHLSILSRKKTVYATEVNNLNKRLSSYIDELEEKNDLLGVTLEEKNLLMREVHHRVKNNFQKIIAIMDMSKLKAKDDEQRNLFLDIENRIFSMSIIHTLLYQEENLVQLSCDKLVKELFSHLKKIYSRKNVIPEIDCRGLKMNYATALPFSSLLNEIMTNSLKHGQKDDNQMTIQIHLEKENDEYLLTIGDNGKGMNTEDTDDNTLGKVLIDGLVQQLRGTIEKDNTRPGTHFRIQFYDIPMI